MVKKTANPLSRKYSQAHLVSDSKKVGLSRGTHLRTHFKNSRELGAVLRGMTLANAYAYLDDVTNHRRCVPFRRFAGGVGRTSQAKEFKATLGRWPVKSAKFMRDLLKNAESNAIANELASEDLSIRNVVVQQAPKTRRRTYRAHGRINPYQGHPCHIEIILGAAGEEVPKAKESGIVELDREESGRRQIEA
ncbi:60S ribosomal protein L17B [Cystobasidiomycetes sp. EMM_F5]